MKTITQVVLIVWLSLALESQMWKFDRVAIFITPLVVVCLFGMRLIAGGGRSSRIRAKNWGRIILGLGTFCIGAVLHLFRYEWDAALEESLVSSWEAIGVVVGLMALGTLVVFLMHKSSLRNLQQREGSLAFPPPKSNGEAVDWQKVVRGFPGEL